MNTIRAGIILPMILLLSIFPGCQPEEQQYSHEDIDRWSFLDNARFRGKAELAEYSGTIIRYGQPRDAELVLITVMEPFIRDQMVKSESQTGFYAIKQNQVLSYRTGVYPYRQMNSVFWQRQSGRFLKAVMTTQEWCGQTYRELRSQGKTLQLFYSSYWEDESRGYHTLSYPTEANHVLMYDELPLYVRKDNLQSGSVALYPMLMSSQIRRPDWDIGHPARMPDFRKGTLKVETEEVLRGGQKRQVRVVTVTQDSFESENGTVPEKIDVFYVDLQSSLRPLLRWERNDGGVLELNSINYTDYWSQNDPGDRLPQNSVIPE